MKNLHHGLNIYLRNLNAINIASDGNSATMGGGVYGDQVIRYLAANGKVAGSCTCTSLLGPALGGGFNRYQGLHGLLTDNILSLTLVTANGTLTTASPNLNSELFWAMRGAGHNFGIVTSVEYRIFEDQTPTWWVGSFTFAAQESLDTVFAALGKLNNEGEQDRRMTLYTALAVGDDGEVALTVWVYFAGSASDASSYIRLLLALQPRKSSNQSVPYTELADAVGTGTNSPVCGHSGISAATFPIGLREYDIGAIHRVYDLYTELVAQHPDFRASAMQFEAYPMEGVRNVDGYASTAYAHRGDNILISFLALYTPSATNDDIAHVYGTKIRRALLPPGDRLNA
ncbi:MAG: hypothetical protein Q9211_005998, partial [Gyalolechia sp. 1 TL-2023]